MCGIAGAVWSRETLAVSPETLQRMVARLRHRGPDDAGTYFSGPRGEGSGPREETAATHASSTRCALGHRRLSIIDLGTGHQPLSNEDGSVWVVFNGEIYNYRELREELVARGHRFSTGTDTEVIVHLYEEQGPDCVHQLRGMFAFALWDERRGRLMLSRDRLGQKPLFYRHDPGRLLFASELKSLLEVPGLPREVDPQSIDLFLTYQYVPHPRSILKGFQKLPPAHTAVYENDQLTLTRYWRAPYTLLSPDNSSPQTDSSLCTDGEPRSEESWKRALRETLTEAVRLRMRSDVPIGAFLSGGIDSTIIAGLMQSLSETPIHTFSIGFPVKEFDESAYAREAAAHLGTEHHEYVVNPSALEMLPRLIWHYDEPFGDSSAIPTTYLSEVTRQVVTVALSGDGGDELFVGYPRYQAVALAGRADRLPASVRRLFAWKLWQRIPTSTKQNAFGRRLKRFIGALGQSPERRYLRWVGIFGDEMRRTLYSPAFRNRLGAFDSGEFILRAYEECPDRDFVTRTTCADVMSYLPCDILTKVDIASMSCGLEARSPFLDHRVAELAARMPLELKFRGGTGKRVLIETFADLLPESIQKRSKMGFGVPLDHWFRNELQPLLRETLLSDRCFDRGYFRPEMIEQLVEDHVNNRWDHSYRLWNLLCLEYWHQIYIDGEHVPVAV